LSQCGHFVDGEEVGQFFTDGALPRIHIPFCKSHILVYVPVAYVQA